MQMSPAGIILTRVLPDFPTITGLFMAAFLTAKNKKPIMIGKETSDPWDLCST